MAIVSDVTWGKTKHIIGLCPPSVSASTRPENAPAGKPVLGCERAAL